MAFTFKQSGRSMIEMLAVLAIMGILTLGGIAGYRYAMNKSTANTITKEVSLRAASIMNDGTFSRYQIDAPIAALGFKGQIGAFTYEQTKSSTTTFTVTVFPVSQSVCRRIAEMAHPNALSVSINEQLWQEGDTFLCTSDENTIDFVFAAIPQGQMLTDFACGPCYDQSGDECIYKCVGNQICSDAGCVCPPETPVGADSFYCICRGNKVPNASNVCACPGNMTDPDGDNTCTCPSPTTYWNGSACVCPTDTPTGADPTTCACPDGMTEDALTNECVFACEDPTPYWDTQTQTCVACLADENCDTCYACQDKACVKKECALTCPDGMILEEDECGCPTSCCCTQEEVEAGAICLDGVCKQAYCDPTSVLCSQAKCPDGMRLMTREEALSVANAHTYDGPCNANWTSTGHTMVCGYRTSPYERIIVDLTGSWDASETNCLNENYGNAGKYWWHGSCGNPTTPSTGKAFTFCIEK